jgi:hypothetical protein
MGVSESRGCGKWASEGADSNGPIWYVPGGELVPLNVIDLGYQRKELSWHALLSASHELRLTRGDEL